MIYLAVAKGIATRVASRARSIVDVGSFGTPILDWFPDVKDRFSVDLVRPYAGPGVTPITSDFLTWEPGGRRFDIVVSNPPYIPASERILLDAHVVEHEPHLALFVPDPAPLLFYRKLAELGPSILAPGGRMYMETHHAFASEVEQLFRDAGYQQVDVRKDIHEKPRMVRAEM